MRQGPYSAFTFYPGYAFAEPFNLGVIKRLIFPSARGDGVCFPDNSAHRRRVAKIVARSRTVSLIIIWVEPVFDPAFLSGHATTAYAIATL
jgi:hypothetical protein